MVRPEGDSRGIASAWPARVLALLLALPVAPLSAHALESASDPVALVAPASFSASSASRGPGLPQVSVSLAVTPQHLPGTASRTKLAQALSGVYGPEERAQELYLDAMEKLDAGYNGVARDMLTELLARYPATKVASVARRRLSELKAVALPAAPPAPATAVPTAAAPAAEVVPQAGPPVSSPRAAEGSGPIWDQELRRNSPIQSRLRTEAGDRVFFSAGSAVLGSRALAALAAQAKWLNRWHEFEAAIEGHADEAGSEQEDLRLSRERAEAVRRRLIAEGVEPSRLAVVAQGRSDPIAVCSQPECRAQNRRVVTLVFVSGTNERLGLNTAPVAGVLGEVATSPTGEGQPLPAPLAAEWDGTAR